MNIASTIDTLYQQYGQLKGITIECQNELVAIGIKNKAARAEVFLQGAQLTRYQRTDEKPLLFLSGDSSYKIGSSLRGGIPICWPWFSQLDKNPEQVQAHVPQSVLASAPAHGCVRDEQWQVTSIQTPSDSLTTIELEYNHPGDHPHWPFSATLRYQIYIGETLSVRFSVTNTSDSTYTYSSALHTYLAVSDIHQTQIAGFTGSEYIDALDDWSVKTQTGPIHFNGEMDSIYQTAGEKVQLIDKERITQISSTGSNSTVIWNPWIEKSKQLPQLKNNDYLGMVCIETANAINDTITLEKNQEHVIQLLIEPS